MNAKETNELIVRWAVNNGYPCRSVSRAQDEPRAAGVMVLLEEVDVYFEDGRLVRIDCRRDQTRTSQLAREMMSVFTLCGIMQAAAGPGSENRPQAARLQPEIGAEVSYPRLQTPFVSRKVPKAQPF